MPSLQVNVASVNIKKLDLKVYGIERPMCSVVLTCEGVTHTTEELFGLDPIWEANFEFQVSDPETVKVEGKLMCSGKQLGDMQTYALGTLVKGKPTFKGIIVPGGKVDMMFTAADFGNETEPEGDDSFMDFL